ncbi:lipocalin-like domain-containing protein [Nitrospirillum amazonense]|uniref:Lipocalin-like protein n=1 Tax=Nitrospirillum amazonense TaxID=28077 RepID=A0A560KLU5_9PROT|nr:lipocalin-like domain-containing protein [Nitrospirillum amazonense]MDG3444333.1 lipocalin-like domain-containing protein [Nitrospirillum amazonense]TWB83064.1 lipocalin-like protein [Nitrospirillum amazonense]
MTRFNKGLSALAMLAVLGASTAARATDLISLEGTWVMDAAYEIHADGSRTTNYGEHPLGLLTVDSAGRYNMQIFRVGRPAFASGVKTQGTAEEYRQAVLGSSTHFGTVQIDRAHHQLVFDVQAASFPNWEGKRQVRDYTYDGGLLSYGVPASASGDGTVAYSVWRKAP